jgi:hypothetical protein
MAMAGASGNLPLRRRPNGPILPSNEPKGQMSVRDDQPMIKRKIFLASTSELKTDREQFEILISRKNNEWLEKGIFLELVL